MVLLWNQIPDKSLWGVANAPHLPPFPPCQLHSNKKRIFWSDRYAPTPLVAQHKGGEGDEDVNPLSDAQTTNEDRKK